MQTIEEMKGVLTELGIEFTNRNVEDVAIERLIEFEIDGIKYIIEWWANDAYLHIGGMYGNCLPFTVMCANSSWPSYVRGIKFSESSSAFYVAVEKLDWQKGK